MNVSELIAELQKYPQDMNVRIYPPMPRADIVYWSVLFTLLPLLIIGLTLK